MFDGGPLPDEPIEPWLNPRETDRNAQMQERLKALGAFTCIAIGAVAGLEMVIGGGFDFINLGADVREVAPSNYVAVYQAPWSPEARVVALSSTEPLFAGEFIQVDTASDRLNGGYDDPATPDMAYPEVDDDELYRRINALYESTASPAYEDAPIVYDDAPARDAPQTKSDPYAEAEAMTAQALAAYENIEANPS